MVITIEEYEGQKNLKRSYNHDCARPLFACMNPELTYTLPVYQTASGASDIMMHTMERYFTNTKDVDLIAVSYTHLDVYKRQRYGDR